MSIDNGFVVEGTGVIRDFDLGYGEMETELSIDEISPLFIEPIASGTLPAKIIIFCKNGLHGYYDGASYGIEYEVVNGDSSGVYYETVTTGREGALKLKVVAPTG